MVPQLPALILFLDARLLALNALLLIVIIYLCHFLFLALPQHFPVDVVKAASVTPWRIAAIPINMIFISCSVVVGSRPVFLRKGSRRCGRI